MGTNYLYNQEGDFLHFLSYNFDQLSTCTFCVEETVVYHQVPNLRIWYLPYIQSAAVIITEAWPSLHQALR